MVSWACSTASSGDTLNILEVKGLTKHFGGVAALKDVSFDVLEREIHGFIGPNGAGKTTLFALITGAIKPSGGKVQLRDNDVTGKKSFSLVRSGIVRTHQVVRPFRAMTALENAQVAVHYGRKHIRSTTQAREAAYEVLKLVGLRGSAFKLASALSLGDQKRLEVARALATNPDILLCDEVCGGLTHTETHAMLDLFRRIRESGTTIMYVEHDVKAVMAVCDRITVLNFGEKLAEGTPHEIQHHPAVIEAYLGHAQMGRRPSA
jgi:branched-chain amino acid transport system ATP-binding protein